METAAQEGNARRCNGTESPVNRLRRAGRWLALAAAVALAWPLVPGDATGLSVPSPVAVPAALSPYVGLLSALALRSFTLLTLFCLPVLVLALLSHRWFCRHACPVGLLQDLAGLLCSRFARAAQWLLCPPLGQWAVLLTLGGACLGYPFLLWLDPLGLLSAFVSALRQPWGAAGAVAGLGLPLVLFLALLLPNLWCRRICPLGATQEILAAAGRFLRRALRRQRDTAAGTGAAGAQRLLPRRVVLGAGVGALAALGLRKTAERALQPLRPPGAVDERTFAGLCLRCGNCARTCPAKIIHPDLGEHGAAGFMTPVVLFREDYCHEDCHACNRVCPSGALARLSLAEKRDWPMGLAYVDLAACLMANGRDCSACITQCPYQAVARQDTDDGFTSFPVVDRRKCTGCGACEAACPVWRLPAVRVRAGTGRTST